MGKLNKKTDGIYVWDTFRLSCGLLPDMSGNSRREILPSNGSDTTGYPPPTSHPGGGHSQFLYNIRMYREGVFGLRKKQVVEPPTAEVFVSTVPSIIQKLESPLPGTDSNFDIK